MREIVAPLLVATALIAARAPGMAAWWGQAGQSPAAATQRIPNAAAEQLTAILKEPDRAKRIASLDQFIRENVATPAGAAARGLLLVELATSEPARAVALADDMLAKNPALDASRRQLAYTYKFAALRALKDEEAIAALAATVLDREVNPGILFTASKYDGTKAAPLLQKAIVERQKGTGSVGGPGFGLPPQVAPTLEDLNWACAEALLAAGRKEESATLFDELTRAMEKGLADLEALPPRDPRRGQLPAAKARTVDRYQQLAEAVSLAGYHDKALEFLSAAERIAGDRASQVGPAIDRRRAEVYERMGQTERAFESLGRSYAARPDPETRDSIAALARRHGKQPEEIYALARRFREKASTPMRSFKLKTDDGQTLALRALTAKVILVNFFYPT